MSRGSRWALACLAAIAVVTLSWWTLALWPATADSAAWLVRARVVCFGAAPGGLPNAGGWALLLGEPAGMLAVLLAVWGGAVGEGLRTLAGGRGGRLALTMVAVLGAAAVVMAARTIRRAGGALVDSGAASVGSGVTVMAGPPPPLRLVDQHGDTVTLQRFRGERVVLTFAYGHCETVCPLVVHDLMALRRRTEGEAPIVVVVTLDPWRDTPARLSTIAAEWELDAGGHVLSGPVERVERTLNEWHIARTRDPATGNVAHIPATFVIDRAGHLVCRIDGDVSALGSLLHGLTS
jgi:protein SCO1